MGTIRGRIGGLSGIGGKIGTSGGISGQIKVPEKVSEKEIVFANHYEFPNVGDPRCLYIAIDENKTFYYDDTTHTYNCVGSNYEEIDSIQCRLKED